MRLGMSERIPSIKIQHSWFLPYDSLIAAYVVIAWACSSISFQFIYFAVLFSLLV